jgi:signal transduction histidine kinase
MTSVKTTLGYIGVLAGCFGVAMFAGYLGAQIDNDAYDFLFRWNPPAPVKTQAIVVGIDDATFSAMGGPRRMRPILTQALHRIAEGRPKAVAIDILLHDEGREPADIAEDTALADAIRKNGNVILPTNLDDNQWEDPAPVFVPPGGILGHIKADVGSSDGVTRQIPLSQASGRRRCWALALEAYRIASGAPDIVESMQDIEIGDLLIPASHQQKYPLRIVYAAEPVPRISVVDLVNKPDLAAQLNDKVVFLGVTSLSSTGDRIATPNGAGHPIPGVEVHAQVFETLERGKFLTDASSSAVVSACVLVAILAGLIFAVLSGRMAYLAGAALLVVVHTAPFALFRSGIVFPYFGPLLTAWLTLVGAATYQHFVVRRQLRKSEVERARYRQAIHFVTHEMRSPLTAIQGSSEMMGRYNLNEDKRKQIAAMINSESKRLARMIQTFLDVERLADGQMELKRDPFSVQEVVDACLGRVRPLAERKNITINVDEPLEGESLGDRELIEYAVYNVLTNAVKYSAAGTEVSIACHPDSGLLRLSIKDQGIGMDAHELKQIFTRFYRTKRAEASGEPGTGIGLSIVDQIVKHHGGRMEVTSAPGKGSCFTLVLPRQAQLLNSTLENKETLAVEKEDVRKS